jgi:hypothetical protein
VGDVRLEARCRSPLAGVRFPLCLACLKQAEKARISVSSHVRSMRSRLSVVSTEGGSRPSPASPELPAPAVVDKSEELRRIHEKVAELQRLRKQREDAVDKLHRVRASLQMESSELGARLVRARSATALSRQLAWRRRFYLEKLRRIQAMNDAFHVWHSGPVGTINGCRLGRLPGLSTEWAEVNAALGQVAFMLTTIAKHLGYVFQAYRIIPMGSFTRLCPVGGSERSAVMLYFDGGFFAQSRINSALRALGVCVMELQKHVAPMLSLPYRVADSGEKVGSTALTLSLGARDEEWTHAMVQLLTNLKWLLAWTLRHAPPLTMAH